MAEKKEKTLVAASENTAKKADSTTGKELKEAAPVGNAKALRWEAVGLWILGLALEIIALFLLIGKITIPFLNFIPTLWQAIIALALDFGAVVWGAQLWKKANHIDPVSEQNKLKWWLWDNMGVIAAAFCFVPFIILVLTNNDLDQKTKGIATGAAAVLCVAAGLLNYDWNPVSSEMKDAAVAELGATTVYWSRYGKVYHTSQDCQALNQSDSLTYGTVEEAIAANRSRLCKFCADRDGITDIDTN